MASPMPPEPSAGDWAQAERDYLARERERKALLIESVLDTHGWPGGYMCKCGYPLNSPDGWGRHILLAALEPDE